MAGNFPEGLNICFFASRSGAGKTTVAQLFVSQIENRFQLPVYRLNVADPLHDIQQYAYSRFRLTSQGQDGQLLQFLASHFEPHLGKTFQSQYFELRSRESRAVIVNSDCRNNAYQVLKDLGFIFVEVSTPNNLIHARARQDVSVANLNHLVEQTSRIRPDLQVDNSGTIPQTSQLIQNLIEKTLPNLRAK